MGSNLILLGACLAPFLFAFAAWRIKRAYDSRAGRRRFAWLVLGNACVFLGLASTLFLAAEVYYRFLYDDTDSFVASLSAQRFSMKHYKLNNFGLRDNVDYTFKPTDDRRRMAFLGDSFTVGHGIPDVEDRFLNRIRRSHGDRWDVHLFGTIGSDTDMHLFRATKAPLMGYEVDQYVMVYVLNDIIDLLPEWREMHRRIDEHVKETGFLVRHSYAINTFYFRYAFSRDPAVTRYYDMVREAYSGPYWPIQQTRLFELARICRSQGAGFCIVIFPFLHELDRPEYVEAHRRLTEYLHSIGVPTLDLLPLFQQHKDEALMVNRYDCHPNEYAHGLAADAIAQFLEQIERERKSVARGRQE